MGLTAVAYIIPIIEELVIIKPVIRSYPLPEEPEVSIVYQTSMFYLVVVITVVCGLLGIWGRH